MYIVKCDDNFLYHPKLKDYDLNSAKLELEANAPGSFDFVMNLHNPMYGKVNLMKSIIKVYENDELLFEGRPYLPKRGLYNNDTITCEGALAYLNDSIIPPYNFSAETVEKVFTYLINEHNKQVDASRQFVIGSITAKNDTERGLVTLASESYNSTRSIIAEKLVDRIGGYLNIRFVDGKRIIDYLSDTELQMSQTVSQGINLLDAKVESQGNSIATVVIPLGEKTTTRDENGDEITNYLTIESVNGGKNYLENAEAIGKYGRITTVVEHDDITLPENLLTAGRKDLEAAIRVPTTISVTAADLSKANYNVQPFRLLYYTHVTVQNLGINQDMLITKLSLDLFNPAGNKLELGSKRSSYTSSIKTQMIETADSRYQELSREDKKSQWLDSKETQELNRLLANSLGLHLITTVDATGAKKYFFCDGETLETSDRIWTFQANGLAWTRNWNNGNPEWQYGFSIDGGFVANAIKTATLTAYQVTSGILQSADGSFYVNLDSGDVRIGNVSSQDFIGATSKANEYTDSKIEKVNSEMTQKISNIDQHFLYDPQNGARIVTSTDSVYLQLLSSLIRFVLDGNTVSEWNAEENSFKSANGVFTNSIRIGNVLIINRQGSDGSVRITAKRLDDEV